MVEEKRIEGIGGGDRRRKEDRRRMGGWKGR